MRVSTKASSDITRAAERYLEQYGDPLVMNTYLKVTILVLAVVCTALAVLLFRGQMALANVHPLIVRINDVGRAEAIDYRNFQYRPQEAENKYYLTRWAELYFSRNRFTIERDQTNSLYFLNGDVQRAVIDQERKDNIIANYAKDSSLPFVDVEVKNVDSRRPAPVALFGPHRVREDLHQSLGSYRAQAGAMDRQRHLRLPRDGKEQRAGREPPRIDHRPLPGRPGVRVDEATSHTRQSSCPYAAL